MLFFRSPQRRGVVRLAVAFLAAISLSGPAWASQADPAVAPPALRDALRSACQNHPAYRATQSRLAASRARLDAVGQPLYNPEIEFAADYVGPDRTVTGGVNLTLDLPGTNAAHLATARTEAADQPSPLLRFYNTRNSR